MFHSAKFVRKNICGTIFDKGPVAADLHQDTYHTYVGEALWHPEA